MLNRLCPVIVLCVSCQAAIAADRLVPQQYSTIQAAINASVNGDSVVVSPGTYNEAINFSGRRIAVRLTGPLNLRERAEHHPLYVEARRP